MFSFLFNPSLSRPLNISHWAFRQASESNTIGTARSAFLQSQSMAKNPCELHLSLVLRSALSDLFLQLSPAEGNWLPCEVFSGVPLCRYHRPELGMEPAPHHQGSGLRGGPALHSFHLQLHHVSQFRVVFTVVRLRAWERKASGWTVLRKKSSQQVVCFTVRKREAR